MSKIKSDFTSNCDVSGREYVYQESNIDNWTIRDFVSEAQYQVDMRADETMDSQNKYEIKIWKNFVTKYSKYLTNDIKCTEEHMSLYDKF